MPPKRQPRDWRDTPRTRVGLPFGLLTLAALSSPISQATLAPVFGAIPSAVNHKEAVIATSIVGFLLRVLFKDPVPRRIAQYTAAWAFWVPIVQMYLFNLSGTLGPQAGPALIGFLSCHTILLPTVYAAAEAMESLDMIARQSPFLGVYLPGAIGVLQVFVMERLFQAALPRLNILFTSVFTPVKMQLLLASTYSCLAPSPSMLRLLAIPALIHAFLANPHFDSARTLNVLNGTLHTHNWTIADRRWSTTGYISVLESLNDEYRVLRCDHSLLGGEWQLTEERRVEEAWKVNEPIYAAFEMMEAVRLIELDPVLLDAEAHALVIGLGIGTAPKAFIAHGIDTTIVELDPIVHEYAVKYFGLPENHTAIVADAVQWVSETAAKGNLHYDYIIHDVFTGGAEPLALFTDIFLQNLRSLLTPNGAIVLNYAGDLTIPLTIKVLNTIDMTFDSQCKIYRDTPPELETDGDKVAINDDFTNMVIFCRNSAGPITFRTPSEADFLGSKSREHYMLPDPRLQIQFPLHDSEQRSQALPDNVIKQGEWEQWVAQQAESALKHWYIMRKVVPDAVWELW